MGQQQRRVPCYLHKLQSRCAWHIQHFGKRHNYSPMQTWALQYDIWYVEKHLEQLNLKTGIRLKWLHDPFYFSPSSTYNEVQVTCIKHMSHDISRIVNKKSELFIILVRMVIKLMRILNPLTTMSNIYKIVCLYSRTTCEHMSMICRLFMNALKIILTWQFASPYLTKMRFNVTIHCKRCVIIGYHFEFPPYSNENNKKIKISWFNFFQIAGGPGSYSTMKTTVVVASFKDRA